MTALASLSVFIIIIQQTSPSFSQATTAILSFGLNFAFSRRSFGRTIWPFTSMVMIESIRQESPSQLAISSPLKASFLKYLNILIFLKNTIILFIPNLLNIAGS